MKRKLTVTVDDEVISRGKDYASKHRTSLSSVIERALRSITRKDAPSFTARWAGSFSPPAASGDRRMRNLQKRYS